MVLTPSNTVRTVAFIVSFVICLFVIGKQEVNAETFSDEEQRGIYESLSITAISDFKGSKTFTNFDVNEEGEVIVSFDNMLSNSVVAFDKKGEYLFGFAIKTQGSFYVEWSGDNICLFLVRSSLMVTMNKEAELISIVDCSEQYYDLIYKFKNTENISTNEGNYSANSYFMLFGTGHYKLTRECSDGVIDIYSAGFLPLIIEYSLILIFISAYIVIIVYRLKIDKCQFFKLSRK